jgi:flagellar hook-length control protein FliK
MQVNLLCLNDTALPDQRVGGVLLALQGECFEPLLKHQTQVFGERARRAAEHDPEEAAAQAATCSANVIKQAERNVEGSSRSFRRQVAHEGGVEQFRETREGRRQAGQDRQSVSAGPQRDRPAAPSEPQDAHKPKETGDARNTPRLTLASAGRHSPTGQLVNRSYDPAAPEAASPARASTGQPVPGGLGRLEATPAHLGEAGRARGLPGGPQALRTAVVLQLQAAGRSGGAGSGKGSSATPVVSLAARGATRAAAFSAVKLAASRSAENADRSANLERIVRLVAQSARGERSHTVMRLDPPELGSLRLQMDLRGEFLTLRIDTSTHVAHRLLTEDVDKLRQGLEASGIQLERVDLRPPPAVEAGEQRSPQQAGAEAGTQGDSREPDAEHPEDPGRDSHPALAEEGEPRGSDAEPAPESLVNVVA